MTRKRLIKLLMGSGISRDTADALALIANMFEPSYEVAWPHIRDSLRGPYGEEVPSCE